MKLHGLSFFSDKNQLEKNVADKDVIIQNCGYYLSNGVSYDFNRFEDAYLILYQNQGTSTIYRGGKAFKMEPGNVYIFNKDENVNIYYHSEKNNERYYIYFYGKKIEYYFKELNIGTNEIYNTGYFPLFIETCKLLIEDFEKNGFENKAYKEILLLNIFAKIHKKQTEHIMSNAYKMIKNALDNMTINYKKEPLSNTEYARLCHVSISTLINMFREYTGYTPQKYIMAMKIESAQKDLIYTNKTVTEIADELNFIDPLYFTRVFKKFTGLSPTIFRKRYLEK